MPDANCTAIVVHPEAGAAEEVESAGPAPVSSSWNAKSSTAGGYTRKFRGLSNQGATCYLNSLLQSLYMTPEFRKAIFEWQYDKEKDGPEDECIPYQLQNLFGRMQISTRGALDTEALTKSFGWGNAEAFQQQDVQELCRVLFDCLEDAFKGTPNATLVNDLYQGEMVDYLKTIGYDYQSNRSTHFLDISLQVKTFGSDVAMNSVAESLESFLRPEKLEGGNQLYCEEADAKFDAIKGFRFEKLPYILTLQLKRFDLDYTSEALNRIKLNDQVRFPLILNMNPYVTSKGFPDGTNKFERSMSEERSRLMGEATSKSDQEEEEDKGLPLPDLVDASGNKAPDQLKEEEVRYPEDDEVDVEAVLKQEGPWVYELYAVLIHSGSALGGHYYAYIKSMTDGKWYNFNDSVVSEISASNVRTAWGSAAKNGTSSSNSGYGANAYMLLYRKIDKTRNIAPPTDDEVPKYILEAAEAEAEAAKKEAEEQERLNNQLQLKVMRGEDTKTVYLSKHETLRELKKQAAQAFGMTVIDPEAKEGSNDPKRGKDPEEGASGPGDSSDPTTAPRLTDATTDEGADAGTVERDAGGVDEAVAADKPTVHIDDIRVREFSMQYKMLRKPYSPLQEQSTLSVLRFYDFKTTGLEIRQSGEKWEPYDDNAVVLKLVWYNETAERFDDPAHIMVPKDATVAVLRSIVANKMRKGEGEIMLLKLIHGSQQPRADIFSDDTKRLQRDLYLYEGQPVYAESMPPPLEDGSPGGSRSLNLYQSSHNQIVLKFSLIGEATCDQLLTADRRWTVNKLREELASRLGLEEDEQKRNFRIRKQILQGTELKLSDTRTLKDEALFNDCKLFLLEGAAPSFGEFYWKFFHYQPPDLIAGLAGQTDPDTKECHYEPLLGPDGAALRAKAAAKAKADAVSEDDLTHDEPAEHATDAGAAAAPADVDAGPDPAATAASSDVDNGGGGGSGAAAASSASSAGGAVAAADEPPRPPAADATASATAASDQTTGDAAPPAAPAADDQAAQANKTDVEGGGGGVGAESGGAAAEEDSEFGNAESELGTTLVTPSPCAEDFSPVPLQVVVFEALMIERLRSMVRTQLIASDVIDEDTDVSRIRLREKLSHRCTKVLRDGMSLKQAMATVYDNRELAFQVLPEPEQLHKTHPSNGYYVVVRRWHRASWSVSPRLEMFLLQGEPLKAVNKRLATMTGIDEQDVRVLKVAVYSTLKLADLSAQSWLNFATDNRTVSTAQLHLYDGDALLVHDASEPLRELTNAEKAAIHNAKHKTHSTGYVTGSHGGYPSSSTNYNSNSSNSSNSNRTYVKPKEAGIKIKTRHDRELERKEQAESAEAAGASPASTVGTKLADAVSAVDAGAEADSEDFHDADPEVGLGGVDGISSAADVQAMFGVDGPDCLD